MDDKKISENQSHKSNQWSKNHYVKFIYSNIKNHLTMKNLILIAVFFASLMACQSDTSKNNQGSEAKTTTPMTHDSMAHIQSDTMMHAHTYACPMHPEETSQKEGDKCSKCGMNLVHNDSK